MNQHVLKDVLSYTRYTSIDSCRFTYMSQRQTLIQSLIYPYGINSCIFLEVGFHFGAGSTLLLQCNAHLLYRLAKHNSGKGDEEVLNVISSFHQISQSHHEIHQ